ncbi:MAG: hypothetical protein ACLTTW_06005 [Coprobacter sp.]
MDGELIDLEFRRKESGDLVYCGYNLKIYLQTNGELIFEQECGIFKVKLIDRKFLTLSDGKLIFENCIIEPTYNGVMIKHKGEECRFKIETDNEKRIEDKEGTVLLSGDHMDTFAMITGLVGFVGGKVIECRPRVQRYSKIEFYINVCSPNATDISFEISAYCPKFISDTVIKQEDCNFSGPFSGICCSYKDKEKRLLFRPTNTLTRYLKNEQNKSIVLYLPKLYGEKFVINKLLNSWCSFRTTWQDCPMYEDRALRYTSDGNNITIDLTQEYGKNAVAGYGFMLRRQSEGEHIAVSTGDSLYFPYIIEIK